MEIVIFSYDSIIQNNSKSYAIIIIKKAKACLVMINELI